MRLAKHIGVGLVAYAVVFFFVYSTVEIHRQGFDKAFYDWYKNHNAETEAALKRERHQNDVARLQDGAIGAAFLVGQATALGEYFASLSGYSDNQPATSLLRLTRWLAAQRAARARVSARSWMRRGGVCASCAPVPHR